MILKNAGRKFDPTELRKTVLEMAYAGNTVHIACAFSLIELLAVLYRTYLRYPENEPNSPCRDYLVLSKGHGVMAQYACMHELGWITKTDIKNYFKDGTRLKGLSDSRVQGLEVTSGSLGHGFSVGVGIAKGLKLSGKKQKVYTIVGDGELNEGAIWEGALFAAHHNLNNMLVVVDKNGFQAMGSTDDVLDLGDLESKFQSFGFDCLTVDGHDERSITQAICELFKSCSSKPKALIANTVKGKGVSFMECKNAWHYTRLSSQSYQQALDELEATGSFA